MMRLDALLSTFTGLIVNVLCCPSGGGGWGPTRPTDMFIEWYTERTFDIKPIWKFYTRRCNTCPRIYLPVCGDDNLTYTNECKLRCSNHEYMKEPPVQVTRRGMCRPLL